MNPEHLVKSIYLGDRACKAIVIDSWRKRVAIQVDSISRLRPGSKTWDFYTDADIEDGWLVFTEVRSLFFEPTGPLPNDFIDIVSVKPAGLSDSQNDWVFELSIGSVDASGKSTEVLVRIEANGVHLEDPTKPGMEIAE